MKYRLFAAVGQALLIISTAAGCGSSGSSQDGGTQAQSSSGGQGGNGHGIEAGAGSGGPSNLGRSSDASGGGTTDGTVGSSDGSNGSAGDSGGADASGSTSDSGSSGSGTDSGGSDAGGEAGPTPCTKTVQSSMDCNAPVAPGDHKDCMLGQREYLIYAPKNLDLCNPVPLVIDGHGASETAAQQLYGMPPFCSGTTCWNGPGSGWRLEAEEAEGGFLLVTPQGLNNMWSQGTDPDFMVQLVTQIEMVANIDPKKIYITGISNGAALSYWTACAHPDIFTGLSPNSGGTLNNTSVCTPLSKPLFDIQFDDMPDFAFSDSQTSVTALAMADNCKSGPTDWKTIDSTTTDKVCLLNPDDNATTLVPCNSIMPAVQPTTCQSWDQCDGNVQVVFCQVAAGTLHGAANAALDGHIIYENSTNLNTPSVAWRFFRSHW